MTTNPDGHVAEMLARHELLQIDYIWLCPGAGGGGTPIRQPSCSSQYSDHCYLFRQLTSV